MRRSCTSPTALISGSFFSEEATAVDAPAPGISVAVVGTVVVVGTAVVVVAGTSVVVGTSMEMSESGASLLHVTAVAYIETTPRQTTTFVDR